ncbi:MAG: cob(I)yrinic acid a,c-diamide adenosyltransferase [Elusimicrobia bacterium]|nr:cob(I)yrinic acid a,c-diamide adenosyltransferase [Elusimicrobiota bacterium]
MASYTRTGDQGETGLFGGGRVPKSHPRVAACGALDELNCALGAARAALPAGADFRAIDAAAARVQAECFAVGALLATPPEDSAKLGAGLAGGLPPDATARLEAETDAWDAELPALKSFILPGGSPAGAALHLARAVCRRAERAVVDLAARESAPEGALPYLNRLSSWLFAAARRVNRLEGRAETPWTGRTR